MQYLRVNSYALTPAGHAYLQAQTAQPGPFNLVFAHGFTMHDRNYPVLSELIAQGYVHPTPLNLNDILAQQQILQAQGKIEREQLPSELQDFSQLETWLGLFPSWELLAHLKQVASPNLHSLASLAQSSQIYVTQLQELAPSASPLPCHGWIHTISDDFSSTSLNLGQVFSYLYRFLQCYPTQWGCYSYGTLNSQILLSMTQAHAQAFSNIARVSAFMGVPLTADNQLSIPVAINQATRDNWSAQAYRAFARSIGYSAQQVEAISSRVQDKDPSFFKSQQQVLQHMWQLNENIFRAALGNAQLMHKWQVLHLATQDAIYPKRNLLRFASQFGLQVHQHDYPHLFNPQELGKILFNWNQS